MSPLKTKSFLENVKINKSSKFTTEKEKSVLFLNYCVKENQILVAYLHARKGILLNMNFYECKSCRKIGDTIWREKK